MHTTTCKRIVTSKPICVLALFMFSVGLASCSTEPEPVRSDDRNDTVSDEHMYEYMVELDKELQEVSGLDKWSNSEIVAIQDERAALYIIDATTGETRTIIDPFGTKNKPDCEGVAVAGDYVYIITSEGLLYCAERSADTAVGVYAEKDIGLPSDLNFEGLCYDKQNQQLLVVAKAPFATEVVKEKGEDTDKENGKKKGKKKDEVTVDIDEGLRRVYAVDVSSGQPAATTFFELDVSELEQESKEGEFSPSGIALDAEGNLTVIAARGHMIATYTTQGEIISYTHLPNVDFPQPEGIVWVNATDVLVASEGAGGKATMIMMRRD